ncbi:hypothetical protein AB0G20_14365 [Streptomyces sp. NPDC024017]
MNRASRQFHSLLKDALHRLRDGVYGDAEPRLSAMRRLMREDLGVVD